MDATAPARRIGRILSLGFPLPGPRVDNYNFLSAPSFFDYDAVVADTGAVSSLIEGVIDGSVEAQTFAGHRVRNVAGAPDDVTLAEALLRRREEAAAVLARGGTVVIFAHAATEHRAVAGVDSIDDYFWLRDGSGASPLPPLVPAEGTQAQIVDYQHPLAPFVLGQLANVTYRVRIDVDSASWRERGARIFARSYGGAVIGADVPAGPGRVALLPPLRSIPSGQARYVMSDTLQACIRRMLGIIAEGRAPSWTAQHPLPGLDERERAVADARRALGEAQRHLDEATAARDEVARYHALLWQEGALGLEPAVVDALRLLGLDVHAAKPDEIELRAEGARVFVEIDAAEEAVGMAPHYRLRQRIEREIERSGGTPPRGLVFVNGYRLRAPAERPQQASDQLVTAATTMRYAVATTSSLFDAVVAALSGEGERGAGYVRRLVTEDGYVA